MIEISTGYTKFSLTSAPKIVFDSAKLMYDDNTISDNNPIDFEISLKPGSFLRRWYRPTINFFLGQQSPFKPLPLAHAYPFLEWGMNWCIASHCHTDLILHSAVLEKNGKAILFPAPPGSGKSTLTAYLMLKGWRLLSDEMAIIDLKTLSVKPSIRPICLKNDSIELIKKQFDNTIFTSTFTDTHKGDVAHLKPSILSQQNAKTQADIVAVVYPGFTHGNDLDIFQLNKADCLFEFAKNAFNFDVIGNSAFEALKSLVEKIDCYEIKHNNLADVESFLMDEIIKYG